MKKEIKNKQGGFIETIILIIVALLIMKFLGITVSEVKGWLIEALYWFKSFFSDVLR